MKIIVHSYPSAEENLAYEEWLFHAFDETILRLWINPRSVVVGKHQNAMAEANVPYCIQEGISVVRRISGGGTVYHDPGNINFSFFRPVDAEKMIDYERNLVLIQQALTTLGYPVAMNARHDLFLNAHKVSGNAQHLRRGRALHHGTILYDADRVTLGKAIKRSLGNYQDKSVKSVRSPIANLRSHLDLGTTEEFLTALAGALRFQAMEIFEAPTPSREELEALIDLRYSQEEWNYGYSPTFTMERSTELFSAFVEVERGGELRKFEVQSTSSSVSIVGQPTRFFPTDILGWTQKQAGLSDAQKDMLRSTLL